MADSDDRVHPKILKMECLFEVCENAPLGREDKDQSVREL